MTEALNPELFSLASQLYVRMRRCSGRVVDAIYMAKNDDYAQEILAIAAKEQDPEVLELVKRFTALKTPKSADVAPAKIEPKVVVSPVLVEEPVKETVEKMDIFSMTLRPFRRKAESPLPEPSSTGHIDNIEEEVAHHYTGALR